ncbi:MAG TPA: 23S rRNA pseudouridine(1911/1915/1917) synthase RluD [Burkholderiales bacterium]|jgi:23S rRNA pseudouridine1911/1915/1917 synthase|nr:23S rRNA pseudouridine(1911/1915/1917) synthase RluD [Burkholderiales bacterium]
MRLDQALVRLLPEYSRNRLQEWIRSGHVTMNGASASAKAKVWGGETVVVAPQPAPGDASHRPEDIPLRVVFEDDQILVIDKPAGMVVHPGSGNWSGTLLNALLRHTPQLSGVPRAGIVHRLDKDTSGLLVVAKTIPAQVNLTRQLQARSVTREYSAVVHGVVVRDGVVEAPIGRHPVSRTRMAVVARGKAATTRYAVRERGPSWSLLRCRLETGRTHQIRVHLYSIGHPLIGDPVYRLNNRGTKLPAEALDFHRQALHARRLALVHPQTGETLTWQAPTPLDIARLLSVLRNA